MSKQKLIYLSLLFCLVIIALYRFIDLEVKRDFLIYSTLSCNPEIENCFASNCSLDDVGCDKTPYKKITIPAYNSPSCVLEHTCDDFKCSDFENCKLDYCTEDLLTEGEECAQS